MVWTMSGIALASCGGGGGGVSVTAPVFAFYVVDGPVYGAPVYFDADDDGDIDEYDKAALQDVHGRPLYVTDENGEVYVPLRFMDRAYIAEVDGAVDTSTGQVLSGSFRPLPDGGLASPLTELIRADGRDPQTVLNEIFTTVSGTSRMTVEDILDIDNYQIQGSPQTTRPLISDADYESKLASYKAWLISRAALGLTEIERQSQFSGLDMPAERIAVLKTVFDSTTHSQKQALMDAIGDREAAGRSILDGKPVAAPDPSVYLREDEVFNIGDYALDAEALFGFFDPQGNDPDEAPSGFFGIYVINQADFTPIGGTTATPVPLLFNGTALAGHQHQGARPANPMNVPSGTFYYVSAENLSRLSIDPTPNTPDMHGTLELQYYVFDGEEWSKPANLIIDVDDVETIAEFAVFENQPVHKTIEFPVNLKGYHLTGGYKDNAHFRIDEDGNVRWNRPSDYENPRDIGRDNHYEIEFFRTMNEGMADEHTHRYQTVIEVKDIGTGGSYNGKAFVGFQRNAIPSEDLPGEFVQHVIAGKVWKMPETGPLVLTYSISEHDRSEIRRAVEGRTYTAEDFYAALAIGFKRIEDIANIKFIEVGEDEHDLPYIPFYIVNLPGQFLGQAYVDADPYRQAVFLDPDAIISEITREARVSIHEYGHVLGLSHPFESERGWPGDESYRFSDKTIMSYHRGDGSLREWDITALQFLYGTPGTNNNGVDALMDGTKDDFPDHQYDYISPELTPDGTSEVSGPENTLFFIARLDGYTVNPTNPLRAEKADGMGTYSQLTGADVRHFEFFQNGTSVLIVSNTEFDYEIPANTNNEYGLVLTTHESSGNRVQTNYRITITDFTERDIRVVEGTRLIANLDQYSLTGPTLSGYDSDDVQLRNTHQGWVVEFISAPMRARPMDLDMDNIYEFIIADASNSLHFDVTVDVV
jgi:hypothetical protein